MFKAAFALCALAHCFLCSFSRRFLEASRRLRHSSSGFNLSVCSVSSCHSRQTDDNQMSVLSDSLCKQKFHLIITIYRKMNVWKCKLIFTTDTLQKKIEITDFNPFLILVYNHFCHHCKSRRYFHKVLAFIESRVFKFSGFSFLKNSFYIYIFCQK